MNKDDIINIIEKEKVGYLKLQFTDIEGFLKTVEVPVSQLDAVLSNEVMFDGSSVNGFSRINESDMFLAPNLDSFRIIPWEQMEGGKNVASFICDVLDIKHQPFTGDPRYILKRQIQKMQKMGFSKFNIGLELEFFLFEKYDPNYVPQIAFTDINGYFDNAPSDKASLCRREIVLLLESIGFEIEASHHEVSQSQHEINFKYDNALDYCDKVQIFKNLVKTIAAKHDMHATFMPKPIHGINGSGMHSNLSLFKDGRNIFYEAQGKDHLSKETYNFVGGLLKHAKEFTAITNPIINSYKRLVAGYEAPCYISYSNSNRTAMIRIPAARRAATRVEVRSVDPTANVYLAMASLLAAGLNGIENKINPGEPISENIFQMSQERKAELGIITLPTSLNQAIKNLEKSEFMKEVLSKEVHANIIVSKKAEYEDYRNSVHNWEVEKYLTLY